MLVVVLADSTLVQCGSDKNVAVATVDGFQGGECDAVVLSLVRLSAFGSAAKRLNVALTRARHQLIVLISKEEKERCTADDSSLLAQLLHSFGPQDTFELN